jgi:hypothetical protein
MECSTAKAGKLSANCRTLVRRYWRSRADPFIDIWDSIVVPLLRQAPQLMGVTLLRKLHEDHPDRFPDGMLRTLQL